MRSFPWQWVGESAYHKNRMVSSRTVRQLLVFKLLTLVACFAALFFRYVVSHAIFLLHVFPRFPPVTCFPALCTAYDVSFCQLLFL